MAERDLSQVESVFHAVLGLPAEKRGAYLAQVCGGDELLYAEVCSLVSAADANDGFIEKPALSLGLSLLSQPADDSMTGKIIGPYKVLSRLGKGGMGEVYLAEDTKLGRKVALKFLSQQLVNDSWAKRQLEKEARAVAQLDHPNICSVYEFKEQENYHFIVMQYVEGQTLSELIRRKSLARFDILDLAKQIVGAIAEAHAHGIIHRDIKPGNIMVTPAGHVKVLDFGLAKIIQQKQNLEGGADSVSNLSQLGLLQGTVAYMSPEQLRGEKLDYRTDLFSIGTVLYEMIRGANPHSHGTHAEIISSILSEKPVSLNRGSNRVSHQLDLTVQKCLEKDREARYQSASELLLKLQTIDSKAPGRIHLSGFFTARAVLVLAIVAFVAVVLTFVYSQWTRPKLMVVLPIRNETGDASLEYLADGFTEGFNIRLSGLAGVQVKPTSLVAGYKNYAVDLLKIGRDLKVDGVLVGKVSGARDLPVLEVRLISTLDGAVIWQSQYSVDLQKSFSIEADVAKNVVAKFESRYAEDENRVSRSRDPENPEARKEYWLGLYVWRNRGNDGKKLDTAIDHFNAAISRAPDFARAYAGLADCYLYANSVAYGYMETREAMTKAERAAKDAIERDESLAEAHTSLGMVNKNYYWLWPEAEKKFQQAIKLKPDYSLAYYGYSGLLTVLGRTDEAIINGRIAKDLDPFSATVALNYCRAIYFARRFDEATKCYDKLVVDHPGYDPGKYARGLVYVRDGMYPEALNLFEPLYKTDKRLFGAALGYTYGVLGRTNDAERVLGELWELQKNDNLPSQELALVYLGLGKMDEAIDLLQRSAEERYAPFPWLASDPLFPKLQADPRFIALIKRYNLPAPTSN